ncbi:MAG TPA: adenylate/guanylate cyclase domain-containing protein, partial [Geminicoccaceae bacterium]|nr:adenylate/guanylate cyclase domain-containing protein [Geminicoccaceae bacterium]
MRCPSCGFESAEGARFCAQCGDRLAPSCPGCGAPAQSGHKFCPACGASLQPGAPEPPPATAGATEGERRQVTVLFVDLVGFTALASELDAEEVHGLLGRFFARADGLVEAFGGRVDKHIGDCVMAVFGAPVAHGNDPERAARAALAIRDAVPALGQEIGREVSVHIGVASGQVVASGTGSDTHSEYTVTGDSVNLAARLTDRAQSGEILVSDAVRRQLPARFSCAEAGALEVKGLARPVLAWRLAGLSEGLRAHGRPFVGRRAELAQFQGMLRACRESGAGQTIYLRGEAGIGKTRLVEEFRRQAEDQGFAFHLGLVLDFGAGTGRDAIRALVRSLLDPSGAETAAVAAEHALAEG